MILSPSERDLKAHVREVFRTNRGTSPDILFESQSDCGLVADFQQIFISILSRFERLNLN